MIFITGDTHRDLDWCKLNTKNFPEQKNLTKNDYVIIVGDFGGVWTGDKKDDFFLDTYQNKNFTTLFVDGNHENHEALNKCPIEIWNGGFVHKLRENVIHLMRGQVFEIEGKTFFTFGGAKSTDKEHRTEFVSWWKEEEPSFKEFDEGLNNLQKVNYKVDYVITHTCPSELIRIFNKYPILDYQGQINSYFDEIKNLTTFDTWYFGHYHDDINLGKYKMLYNNIEKLN